MNTPKNVFRWDLDKTYLRTEFDSLRDLINTALETATDKQAYPGATALLRILGQNPVNRICIVSGSPTQMRQVLQAKLLLDGITYHEFILKNNLRNLLKWRFRAIKSQIPYKLPALIESRANLSSDPSEVLFGDDSEADAIAYSIYADTLSGKILPDDLRLILKATRAYEDEIEKTLMLARKIRHQDSVKRILIHLDRRTPTAHFDIYGRRLVPIYNYFQAALVLYQDGFITGNQLSFVAIDMLNSSEFSLGMLANSLQDVIRRGHIQIDCAQRLAEEIDEVSIPSDPITNLPSLPQISELFRERIRQLGRNPLVSIPAEQPTLDYIALADLEHRRRSRKKR